MIEKVDFGDPLGLLGALAANNNNSDCCASTCPRSNQKTIDHWGDMNT